ncbi:amino acid adenylation domain-containing protein [Xanthomonas sacchari]|nr:amino acid adenylation domain-containing protein [Xanthomonas sacchari]
MIYTSGSTGMPKGVQVTHRGVVNLLHSMARAPGMQADDTLLAITTLSFDIAVFDLFLPLSCGACLVMAAQADMTDPQRLIALIEHHRISVLQATPATWRMLLPWMPGKALTGGEALTPALSAALGTRVAQLWNGYGPTETTIYSSVARIDPQQTFVHSCIGTPVDNTRIYVLDAARRLVPIGAVGEIHIGGIGVSLGYLNRPELTAERFLPDPFSDQPDARMYRTGDLGRWRPDGTLEYHGRNDFQVKLRGFRIELGEIEAQLSACAGVRDALVAVREDTPGDKRLVAYLIAQPEAELHAAELREHLAHVLPEYMLPAAFVTLPAFPLTPTASATARPCPHPTTPPWPPSPTRHRKGRPNRPSPRSGKTARRGTGRPARPLLRTRRSLLAGRAAHRPPASVPGRGRAPARAVRPPSLAAFAAQVHTAARAEAAHSPWRPHPAPAAVLGAATPVFLDQLDHAAGAAYHMPAALRLSGHLDRIALQRTLDRIVERHESLRTTFALHQGEPIQVIAPPQVGLRLAEHDLSHLHDQVQQQAVAERAAAEAAAPFDLEHDRLIRGQLLRLSPTEHVLLVTQHHIVSDGWSIGVLIQEVAALYAAFRLDQPDPLPPGPAVRRLRRLATPVAAWRGHRPPARVLEAAPGGRSGLPGTAHRPAASAGPAPCRR